MLEKIKYFEVLESLDCSKLNITVAPDIPPSMAYYDISYTQIYKLPKNIPGTLCTINVENTPILDSSVERAKLQILRECHPNMNIFPSI